MSHNAVETPFTSDYSYGCSLGKILALQLILFTKITRKCGIPKIILKKQLLKTPDTNRFEMGLETANTLQLVVMEN